MFSPCQVKKVLRKLQDGSRMVIACPAQQQKGQEEDKTEHLPAAQQSHRAGVNSASREPVNT